MVSRSSKRHPLLDPNNGISFRLLPGLVIGALLHRWLSGSTSTPSVASETSSSDATSAGNVGFLHISYLCFFAACDPRRRRVLRACATQWLDIGVSMLRQCQQQPGISAQRGQRQAALVQQHDRCAGAGVSAGRAHVHQQRYHTVTTETCRLIEAGAQRGVQAGTLREPGAQNDKGKGSSTVLPCSCSSGPIPAEMSFDSHRSTRPLSFTLDNPQPIVLKCHSCISEMGLLRWS